jgi:hypothetical protein
MEEMPETGESGKCFERSEGRVRNPRPAFWGMLKIFNAGILD